jgi:hypothetical protein
VDRREAIRRQRMDFEINRLAGKNINARSSRRVRDAGGISAMLLVCSLGVVQARLQSVSEIHAQSP